MEEKKSFIEKVKEHKTEIIIVGFTIILAVGAVLIVKNWDVIKGRTVANLFKNGAKANDDILHHFTEAIENVNINSPSNEKVVDISKYVRNLPEGWKASTEKLDLAIKKGIELGEHQTWVEDHIRVCS